MKKTRFLLLILFVSGLMLFLSYRSITAAWFIPFEDKAPTAEPHNVILIIADDFGKDMAQLYNDPGADLPPTPNINALLDNGVLFENAWTNPICSPTRAAMLTGRYGFRTGIGNVVQASSSIGLSLDEFVLPEAISAGSPFSYTHANVGKWHVGNQALGGRNHPNLSGYDHFSGLLRGGLDDYNNWSKVTNGSAMTITNYATTETVDDAIDWLDLQHPQDKPFFLWVAFNAPHSPFHLPPVDLHSFDTLTTTQSVIDNDPYPYYKAMVEAMDTEIGRLLDSLPADVRANTTVIFIGDNGSPGQVVQDPLDNQKAKGSIYDGGVHVPLLISGPKVVNPDRSSAALVNSVDLYATMLELMDIDVSATLPNTITLDSVSMMPYLTDSTHSSPRSWIFAEIFTEGGDSDDGKTIRNDQYKLIRYDTGDLEFYDLEADQYQDTDLLTSGSPMSSDEEQAYCGLFADLRALLGSEPGETVPDMPTLCDDVQTATPTIIPLGTNTPTPSSTPSLWNGYLYMSFLQRQSSGGQVTATHTPAPTATGTPTPAPTPVGGTATPTVEVVKVESPNSICQGENDFSQIPAEYVNALTRYTTVNSQYIINVCTEDRNNNGSADFMVIESTNIPEHESAYFETSHALYGPFDYRTNIYKYAPVYTDQAAHAAGQNLIEQQAIIMKIPISPVEASPKQDTSLGTIGLALNGVSFYNEAAAPGDEITDELFTFDQCSGHPQQSGVYHYHVDPVCLIRDLGGDVNTESQQANGQTYTWLEDSGNNAELLLGFLRDGFPVYGPVGNGEVDCHDNPVTEPIGQYNGHFHCTAEFPDGIFHYHAKTANLGGTNNPVFWITNEVYYGEPGQLEN